MRIRKLFMGAAVLLACAVFALPRAMAADEVRVTVIANPTELSEAGEVQMNFSISNYSDYELHGVTISSGGAAFDLKQSELIIPPNGSAYDIVINVPIADSQIGLPIEFSVAWTQGGEPMMQTTSVTINRAADPVIGLSRKLSAVLAREGDEITAEYTLTNDTKFDMTGITLIDEEFSDSPIVSNEDLRAGRSLTIPLKFKMSTLDVTSAPLVTYTVLGKTKTFSAIEPQQVKVIVSKLSLSVAPGTPTMDGVIFSLEVKNTGNQDITDITILDDKQNFVNQEPFSLAAGDAESLSYRVVPDMNEQLRNVSFTLTGTDALDNEYKLEPTSTYPVYPYVDDSQIAAGIRAEIIEPWSAALGTLKVRLTIDNQSTAALSSVKVSEQSLGDIKVIDTLAKGETSFEQVLTIGSPRNLTFLIKGYDPAGALRDLGSFTLQVAYTDATAAPEATATPETGPITGVFGTLTGTLTKVLIILAIVMCLAFVTLITLSFAEKRQMNKIERRQMDDDILSSTKRTKRQHESTYLFEEEPEAGVRQRAARPAARSYGEAADESFDDEDGAYADGYDMDYDAGYTGRTPAPERSRTTRSAPAAPERPRRPARAAYAPAQREIPIEVEYDDEAIDEPQGAPVIPLPARVSEEDRSIEHPKVIRAQQPNAVAPRKNEIRRIKKDRNTND